jgi:MoaA/NifB/PqqE/SkfB family radical SAM enzyme
LRDELTRDEALDLARAIVAAGVPYVAFGGGEPLGVAHFWDVLDVLHAGGVELKIETDGGLIDDAAADRLAALAVNCVQISVDGARAETHERVRPGSSFAAACAAIARLVQRGRAPQLVFVPNRLNLHEIRDAFDLACQLGCAAFVTGPMMRIGRAAAAWERIACDERQWLQAKAALQQHAAAAAALPAAAAAKIALAIYPWDIVTELTQRIANPQAMLLVVPNGKVKLLNALPFAPADLRRESIADAWLAYRAAWRAPAVRQFVDACRADPGLLRHANETWPVAAA